MIYAFQNQAQLLYIMIIYGVVQSMYRYNHDIYSWKLVQGDESYQELIWRGADNYKYVTNSKDCFGLDEKS